MRKFIVGSSQFLGERPLEHAAGYTLAALVLQRFYQPSVGAPYQVTRRVKSALVKKFQHITSALPSGTGWLTHVVLAHEIFTLPPSVAGDIVECGTWQGTSAASLSLVCKLVNRKLLVCDSFVGLPADEPGAKHRYPHVGVTSEYRPGLFAANLDEVRRNISRWGEISCCTFVPGFFSASLTALPQPIAFAFLDVDLATSTQDCIKHLWPRLVEGGKIFTDDSCDVDVVKVWFDERWWQAELGESAPGYVGSGCGLPINPRFSSLGYAVKVTHPEARYARWEHHPLAEPARADDQPAPGAVRQERRDAPAQEKP